MTTEPTDAELGWLAKDCGIGWAAGLGGMDAFLRAFASAVLARWGQPAQAAEPVAWRVHPFDYGIGHEGVYAMTMREEQREAWRRKGWNTEPLFAAPQPVAREPLNLQEVEQLLAQWSYELHGDRARYLVRMTEQHHGIKGGQHGTE